MTALSNLKILDFSTLLPGPYATMVMADLGAQVIHIESPNRADMVRTTGPFADGVATAHSTLNRNKRAMTLDLKIPDAIALVKRLVLDYDILVEQFRPGVMDKLGLSYAVLKEINPRLIYCSLTGYGQTGPYRQRAGHDINYLSIAGINGYSGRRGAATPLMGIQVADLAGGSMQALVGILAAVNQRHITGEGQTVDVSMTDGVFALNSLAGSGYLGAGVVPQPQSFALNGGSFYDYYETADGRYLSIGSLEPKFLAGLAKILDEPRIETLGIQHNQWQQDATRELLASIIGCETLAHWTTVFANEDVCVEPVLRFDEACDHAQLQSRGMLVEVDAFDGTKQRQIGSPFKLSAADINYRHSGAPLGYHNREILEELDLDDNAIQILNRSGALG